VTTHAIVPAKSGVSFRSMIGRRDIVTFLIICVAGACSRPATVVQPAPEPSGEVTIEPAPLPEVRSPAWPPIPHVSGRPAIRVIYPSPNAMISVRDSNFVLGTTGTGDATLTINGQRVKVEPNGADTQRVSHPIRLPAEPVEQLQGRLAIDTSSREPRTGLALRDNENVRVAIAAPSNAIVSWRLRGETRPLTFSRGTWSTSVPARMVRDSSELFISRDRDTVRLRVPHVQNADSLRPIILGDSVSVAMADSDKVVIGRPTPGESYRWFFLPGTVLQPTGRLGNYTRVRLDTTLEAWLRTDDVRPAPEGAQTRLTTSSGRVRAMPYGADVILPATARPAYLVEERGNEVMLTLYGAVGTGDRFRYPGIESFVRTVEWTQAGTDRLVYTIRLSRPLLGYHVTWERGALVLRLREPPRVPDESRPLAGLTIAVDPGHPPAGATGPTGLYEGDAVLEVGKILREMLIERGARVVMTRETRDTVDLAARPIMARRADAHALVSIHLNAVPDGVNPHAAQGTETYFFHPHAEGLARAVQIGMLRQMGLMDRGVFTRDLAMARPTWMPSVLAEAAYIILPDAEAGFRTREVQARYAAALLEGLETYFRAFAR
jgi:N-acetylmuramoyl-L-alanine amidase